MERIFRKLGIVVAILVVLGFIANLLIDNPYTHRLLRAAINEKVREYTHLNLDFKAIKAAAVPPGIDLYGVRVTADHAPQKDLLNASHVKLRVSLWSLFLGQPRLGAIEVSDLQLVWPPAYGFAGFLRPERMPRPEPNKPITWPLDFELPIDLIVLNNANVYMEFPVTEEVPFAPEYLVAALVGLDLELDYQDRRAASAQLALGSANLSIGARSMLEDTALRVAIELQDDAISLVGLTIDGERIKAEGDSQILLHTRDQIPHVLEQIEIKSMFRYDADLSILGSYLDIPETRGRTRGEANVNAMIPVEAEAEPLFEVAGSGRVEDGYLSGFKLFDSATHFRVTKEGLALSDILIMIGETVYGKGEGTIQFDDIGTYNFSAQPDQLRLNDLLTALTVSFDVLDTGITSDNLKLQGTGKPFTMQVTATALFDEFTLPATPYDTSKFPLSPGCALAVNLDINSDYLDIQDSKGTCYRKPAPRPIKASVTAPPAGSTDASPLVLDGRIWFDDERGIDLNILSPVFQLGLSEFFSQQAMQGTADVQSRVYGPYTDVQVATAVIGSEIQIAGIPLGRVEGNTTYRENVIGWDNVAIFPGQNGEIRARRGSLHIDDALTFTTQLQIANLNGKVIKEALAGVTKDVPVEVDIIAVEGELSGPLLYPGAWQGEVGIELGESRFGEELLFHTVIGRVESSAAGWQTNDLSIELDSLKLALDVRHRRAFPFLLAEAESAKDPWVTWGLHPDDAFELDIATQDNVAMESLSAEEANHLGKLPFAGQAIRAAEIEGTLQLAAKFKGTTSAMQGTFEGKIARPSVLGSKLSAFDFRGFVTDSKVDLMISHSGNSLEGRLSVDLAKKGIPYEWYFNFNRLDLRAFGTDLFHQDPRNYAYLTADWRMAGEFQNWWASTGELSLQDLRAQYVQDIGSQTKTIQLKQEMATRLLFTQDGWKFENSEELALTGRYFDIRLALPDSRPPENLGFRLTTIIDVEVARAFLQDVDSASGKLRVVAEVNGPVDDPNFTLEVTDLKQNPFIASTWQPVKIGLADLRPPLTNIRLQAVVRDGRLFLESFTANKGNGTVTANGTLNLTDEQTVNSRLDINLNEATIVYPVAVLKSFESQVSGNIFISGSGVPYTLGGDIKVTRARAVQEIDIRDQVLDAFRRQSFTTGLINENPSVIFDINVSADETINIHNRNLQANLSADIQLKGTNVQPIVGGQIEINRGKFIYNRDFTITRGVATFDDPVKPDPSLDILAFSDISTYRVYIAITGKVFEPVIEFSVDPPTTEQGTPITKEEILVLISRGSLPESSQVGGELTSAATSEALNLIMGQFEEPVEKLFDLTGQNVVRNVYIDTYPSENGPIPRFNLPLDLGENFDVIVRLDETATKYSVEYPVHDAITLSGTIEDRHDVTEKTETKDPFNASANLKFRFSFE